MLRLALLFLALSFSLHAEAKDHQCSGSKDELRCVLRFHSSIYQENPEYFWRVLNQSRNKAESCNSVKATADFLRTAMLRNENAELQEFVSEGVETLCAKKPACFRRSLQLLDGKSRAAVREKLKNPLYFDTEELSCVTSKSKVHR